MHILFIHLWRYFLNKNRVFLPVKAPLAQGSQKTPEHPPQPLGLGKQVSLWWRNMWWRDGKIDYAVKRQGRRRSGAVYMLWREVELGTGKQWGTGWPEWPALSLEVMVISQVWAASWSYVDIWVPCRAGLTLTDCHASA